MNAILLISFCLGNIVGPLTFTQLIASSVRLMSATGKLSVTSVRSQSYRTPSADVQVPGGVKHEAAVGLKELKSAFALGARQCRIRT